MKRVSEIFWVKFQHGWKEEKPKIGTFVSLSFHVSKQRKCCVVTGSKTGKDGYEMNPDVPWYEIIFTHFFLWYLLIFFHIFHPSMISFHLCNLLTHLIVTDSPLFLLLISFEFLPTFSSLLFPLTQFFLSLFISLPLSSTLFQMQS